ncbi:MAG: hypothetical protein JKY54_04750 [Flavobacteriales bacterium]|nr:hypothetical protein [Flavobacteriales bacterium]
MRNLLFTILCLLSSAALAGTQVDASGTITSMRTQTTHHDTTSARGETIFQISGSLAAGCDYLSLEAGNDTAISFLLSAQAQSKAVRVWYYSDVKSTAWSTACRVANIELIWNP